MPALIRLLGSVPGAGFSTKRTMRPDGSRSTTPNAEGSSTPMRWMVASASAARCAATRSVIDRSVSTSPLTTTNVSSIPAWSAAKRMAPAVSSGSGSIA